MNVKKTTASLILRVLALLLLASALPIPTLAAPAVSNASSVDDLDVNPGFAAFTRQMYFYRMPVARENGPTEMGGHDVIKNQKSDGTNAQVHHGKSGPVYTWPIVVADAVSPVPTHRDESINDDTFQTFGLPVSDTQYQLIHRYNQNRMLEEAFDPERMMWTSSATAGMQATSGANSAANMSTNQSQSAIDFTKKYLTNFTSQANNRWQQIRDQLFIPMAILLLLPGAVLAQVKAIVSQGSPVLGDTNPWEGILRSIIAIFLIPATFLVINYGIDVSNSITLTIAQEYKRIFGTDMYTDAQCAQLRAFPVNPADRNDNAVIAGETPSAGTGSTAWSPYEALSLNLRQYDPCAKIDNTRTADERVRDIKKITRLAMNGANVALTGTWNVLCAFQMAFLYYLWCMGPIAAALWVWPLQRLRGALPSWIEGVVTLCFWSLFWNTVVLLMACFRGVGDSGTVLMSALNFLADICVKYAFDFSSLVSQGASSGVSSAIQNASQGAASAAGGKQASASGAAGTPGTSATAGTPSTSTSTKGAVSPGLAGLNSALTATNAENNRSGLMGNASGVTGGTGMPPSSASLTASPQSFNTSGTGGVGDAGLPPSSSHPAGSTGMGTQLAGFSAPNPLSSAAASAIPLAFSSAGANGLGANGLGANGASGTSGSGANGGQGLGLHVGSNGQLAVNPEALQSLQNQLKDPNSQLNHQLGSALQQLEQGNTSGLQNLATQLNGGQLDPATQQAFNSMIQQGVSVSPQDMQAINAMANGQTMANGAPAFSFDSNGQLMNNLTQQPLGLTAANGSPLTTGGTDLTNLTNMASTSNLPPLSDTSNLFNTSNLTDASNANAFNTSNTSNLSNLTGAFDPGNPSASLAQLSNQGFDPTGLNGANGISSAPLTGLDGLTAQGGLNGANGGAPSLFDASGAALPPGSVNMSTGQFVDGSQTSNVLAYNSSDIQHQHPIASFDSNTQTWSALNAQGQPTGVSMDASPNSTSNSWYAQTANGAVAPVTMDSGGNWTAAGTNGQVEYNTANHQLQTAGGAPVNYDSNSQSFTAANNSNISYNPSANSFVDNVNGAPVVSSGGNNWYAQGTDGNVTLNSANNSLSIGGSSNPAAQVQYDAQNQQYYTAGGQAHYDQANHRFETNNSNAPITFDSNTNQWYGANSNNSVVFDPQSRQLEAAGSQTPLNYSNGTYFAANTNNQVAYDPQSQSFGVAGTSQPVTNDNGTYYAGNGSVYYDRVSGQMEAVSNNAPVTLNSASGQWYGAGTNGAVQYDTNTGSFYTPSQAPVTYDNGQFTAAGTNGAVQYDQNSQRWESNTSSGAMAYNYDTQNHQWMPQGIGGSGGVSAGSSGGGEVYRVSQDAYAQATPSQFTHQQSSQGDLYQYSGSGSSSGSTNYGASNYTADGATYQGSSTGGVNYGGTNYGGTNYTADGATYQGASYQGGHAGEQHPGQHLHQQHQEHQQHQLHQQHGEHQVHQNQQNYQSNDIAQGQNYQQGPVYNPTGGGTVYGSSDPGNSGTSSTSYYSSGAGYSDPVYGGGGSSTQGGGSQQVYENQFYNNSASVDQPLNSYRGQSGGGGGEAQYVASADVPGSTWNESAQTWLRDATGGNDVIPQHDGGGQVSGHDNYAREAVRDELVGGGLVGTPLDGSQQPPQHYNQGQYPTQQQQGGTFGAIIPAKWGSPRPQQQPNQPQARRDPAVEPTQGGARSNQDAMKLSSPQGGNYKSDKKRKQEHDELLKKSWDAFKGKKRPPE